MIREAPRKRRPGGKRLVEEKSFKTRVKLSMRKSKEWMVRKDVRARPSSVVACLLVENSREQEHMARKDLLVILRLSC